MITFFSSLSNFFSTSLSHVLPENGINMSNLYVFHTLSFWHCFLALFQFDENSQYGGLSWNNLCTIYEKHVASKIDDKHVASGCVPRLLMLDAPRHVCQLIR